MRDQILLGHGSGGKMTHQLIQELFVRYFNNEILNRQDDAAVLPAVPGRLVFTTDSYVVDPIFFPGGDIGTLAVSGTINDLAVSGAQPLCLSVGFIIEEGLGYADLEQVVKSMAGEAEKAGVTIVTGDTKVVNRGKCDRLFINTSGIGMMKEGAVYPQTLNPGDQILINGTIADHGMAVMGARESLRLAPAIRSDCASLHHLIARVRDQVPVRAMRDVTRGGLATVLVELARHHQLGVELDEERIPLKEETNGICELLGIDPVYVANEGKVVMVVSPEHAKKALSLMRKHEHGRKAQIIGEVTSEHPKKVVMHTSIGGKRMIDMLAGEQLPRIC